MSVPYTPPFNLQNGTTADATQVDANFAAVTAALQNAAASGINSDITALTALTTPISPAQGGSPVYVGTTGGAANAQTIATTSPIGFTLTNGLQVLARAGFTNTGAMTLNVAGTGVKNVVTQNGNQPLVGGEVVANNWFGAVYDSTDGDFHLISTGTLMGGVGPVTSVLSATTTDLSLATNHNASITGTATITSFGANANVNFPNYLVTFTGAATLTYNATSLILPGAANITTAAGDFAIVTYLGAGNWQVLSFTRAAASPSNTPLAGFNRLVIKNNSGTPNTNIDVTAASAVLLNGAAPFFASSISFTMNLTTGTVTSTANGMDGEARPTSGFVYLYMISNGATVAGLGSTSASAPTLPAGYTFSAYMGAMFCDGSTNLLRSIQKGNQAQYTLTAATNTAALPTIGTTTGTSTLPVSSVVPSTATSINVSINSNLNNSNVYAGPNTAYTTAVGSALYPIASLGQAANVPLASGWILLESANIVLQQVGGGTGSAFAIGWRDAVNAN